MASLWVFVAAFGAPSAIAILGVISWRLVQFWLPIPAGAAAYVSLRVTAPDKIDGDVAAARAALSPPT
jgi:uncharacterized membrane protein YbhN (UPF0104 family)